MDVVSFSMSIMNLILKSNYCCMQILQSCWYTFLYFNLHQLSVMHKSQGTADEG
jgi:hypothetical protein